MSTKVHDEDDETFDEVDVILETAKAGLQMKRSLERKSRRNINLSDIPENFAHVPASTSSASSTHRRAHELILNSSPYWSPTPKTPSPQPHQRTHRPSSVTKATFRWLRHRYLACSNMCSCSSVTTTASAHVTSRS